MPNSFGIRSMQLLPGFRDFYPDDCARRAYVFAQWREVARRYGFVEYDGPMLEPVDLYKKKSGGELVGQLFDFVDKGERHVALRPEMTPTLARMVVARERDFKKPMRWFSIAQFFRYEKQQRGRLREFCQLNCDLIGEASLSADAEVIALTVDLLRALGFTQEDVVVRVSDRNAWAAFLASRGVADDRLLEFLEIVDKIERNDESVTREKLKAFGIELEDLQRFIAAPEAEYSNLKGFREELEARGISGFVEIDLRIVRGLAYYTGFVFEVFDRARKFRAVAGGGRYDRLMGLMSEGKVDLPALGFGMGDVVLGELIAATPSASAQMNDSIARTQSAQIYVVIAKEDCRPQALAQVQRLRDLGYRVDFPLAPAKVGKQFQTAEQLRAPIAVLFGEEWPQIKLKVLATRTEELLSCEELENRLKRLL